MFLRPVARPLGWGVVVAVVLLAVEALVVIALQQVVGDAFGAVFLLGVLVISAGWGFALAIAMSLANALVYVLFHIEDDSDGLVPALLVFLVLALLVNVLGGQARLRAEEADQRRREVEAAHARVAALADQQTALRRVATLVAGGANPTEVHPVAVRELAGGLGAEHVTLVEFTGEDECVVLAECDSGRRPHFAVGERLSLAGQSVVGAVRRTGRPARIDDYDAVAGSIPERLRAFGLRSGVGTPVVVDGRVRAALVVGSALPTPLPPETEPRIADFADLIATAIFNAESRAEIAASRARVVAAADQARRGFERDLHDGAQQRIVSLGLELRAVEASIDPAQTALRDHLRAVVEGLGGLYTDLQELSRGLHPAVLSKGGLIPALKALGRRSPVPVRLDLTIPDRLPESVEVAAYYVVAEALTNAAKHAAAAEVTITAVAGRGVLSLSVGDDGVGGAASGPGTGLLGLKDRVEALAGRLDIASPTGGGTTLTAVFPIAPAAR